MKLYIKLTFIAMILLLSFNVNGLRDVNKMKDVFAIIKSKHSHITFLQETFWDENFICQYKHLWGGKIFYNNSPLNNRRGVAILISKDCPYNFTVEKCDKEGRFLNISAKIEEVKYNFVNIYAPNRTQDRITFFNNLVDFITEGNTIIAGDFNEIMDPSLDKGIHNTTFNMKSSNVLHSVINDNQLVDIWRYRNPNKR